MNPENINNQLYNKTFLYPKDVSEALSSNPMSNAGSVLKLLTVSLFLLLQLNTGVVFTSGANVSSPL